MIKDKGFKEFGSGNLGDAIMSRGQGNFHCEELDDGEAKSIFICKNHQKELGTNWKGAIYNHVKKIGKYYRCCISSDLFPELSCEGIDNLSNNPLKLQKSMAEKLLLNKGALYHIGISKVFIKLINLYCLILDLCRQHYDAINSLPTLNPVEILQQIEVSKKTNFILKNSVHKAT